MKKKYGVVLKEKAGIKGLSKSEITDMFDMLKGTEAFPVEVAAEEHECSAMGFIAPVDAEMLDYDYGNSGLNNFIVSILDDMDKEPESCEYEYEYNGHKILIYLSR